MEQLQNNAEFSLFPQMLLSFHFFPQTPLVKPQEKEKWNDLTI